MQTQSTIDPVGAAVALSGVLLSPSIAAIIGPYSVIIIASTVGAAWSLGGRATDTRLGAVWYFMLLNGTAVLTTVPIATLIGGYIGEGAESWLLAPVALVIGGIGENWPRVITWALLRIGRLFERKIGGDR